MCAAVRSFEFPDEGTCPRCQARVAKKRTYVFCQTRGCHATEARELRGRIYSLGIPRGAKAFELFCTAILLRLLEILSAGVTIETINDALAPKWIVAVMRVREYSEAQAVGAEGEPDRFPPNWL